MTVASTGDTMRSTGSAGPIAVTARGRGRLVQLLGRQMLISLPFWMSVLRRHKDRRTGQPIPPSVGFPVADIAAIPLRPAGRFRRGKVVIHVERQGDPWRTWGRYRRPFAITFRRGAQARQFEALVFALRMMKAAEATPAPPVRRWSGYPLRRAWFVHNQPRQRTRQP